MRYGRLKVGLAIAGSLGAALTLVAQPAFADYQPQSRDVVGVGSDTLQYMVDFAADGDMAGDTGYNSAGNKFKIDNIDATADYNARLAYGPDGVGSGQCHPGTGPTAGTGNQTATHSDSPCTLNPTVILRAGTSPVQRPNGSGAGAKALAADTAHYITFSRASACQGPTTGCGGNLSSSFDSIQIGSDPLAMLESTTPATNAVPLSAAQLKLIYSCAGTGTNGAMTWNDPRLGGTSADNVVAFIPQVGSGTRSTFLTDIGLASNFTPPNCIQVGEENDPTALGTAVSQGGALAAGSPDAQDAIEPMSGGRLNMFLGLLSDGTANGVGGYFKDPSCPLQAINTSTPAACGGSIQGGPAGANTINPAVKLVTTGTPGGTTGGTLFDVNRPLYIYFRDADVNSKTLFQPTSAAGLNAVRTLFYNPCPNPNSTAACVTIGSQQFGPGGAPYFDSTQAQTDISAAGVVPTYVFQAGGP